MVAEETGRHVRPCLCGPGEHVTQLPSSSPFIRIRPINGSRQIDLANESPTRLIFGSWTLCPVWSPRWTKSNANPHQGPPGPLLILRDKIFLIVKSSLPTTMEDNILIWWNKMPIHLSWSIWSSWKGDFFFLFIIVRIEPQSSLSI